MPALRARRDGFVLAAAFTLALAVRLLPVGLATDGGLRLLSSDSYGHLRRSWMTARAFPRVPVRDVWLNHPEGGVWIWPPLFDLLVGGLARLAFGANASLDDVARVAAALPPVLGALHVVPLFLLARRVLSPRRARLAVAAYAALPAAIIWSQYGHADHHVLEALALLLFLLAAVRAAEAGLAPATRRTRAILLGVSLAGALLVWQGAVFVAGLFALWAPFALGAAGAAAALAATIVLAAGTALVLGAQAVPFSFVSFGWFQPLFLAAVTLGVALVAGLRERGRRTRLTLLVLSAVLLAIVAPNAARLGGAVLRGGGYAFAPHERPAGGDDMADGGYLSYPPELLATISEARPLLSPVSARTALRALQELSPGLLLLPIALLFWWRVSRRAAPGRQAGLVLLTLFGGVLLAMTLLQRRNVYYLALFSALALAEILARALPRRPAFLRRTLAGSAAALLLAVLPGLALLAPGSLYAPAPGNDFLDLLRRLGRLDPPPVTADARPQPDAGSVAGVMAPWSAGHYVTVLTGRPSAADPFAYGWRRQCRLFATPDADEAKRILLGARTRYLVVADLRRVLPAYAAAAGFAPLATDTTFAERVRTSAAEHPLPFLTRVLDSRTGSLAPGGRFLPAVSVFRVDGVEDRVR